METILNAVAVTSINADDPNNVFAEAQVSWSSVAPGYIGRVYYGQGSAMDGSVSLNPAPDDNAGVPANSFLVALTPLPLAVPFVYQVQTVAQDQRTVLAQSNLALFMTPADTPGEVLAHPHANPRAIHSGKTSNLAVRLRQNRKPVPNATVLFNIITGDHSLTAVGQGPARSVLVTTDANGEARAVFTAGTVLGVANVQVSSSGAPASTNICINVRK